MLDNYRVVTRLSSVSSSWIEEWGVAKIMPHSNDDEIKNFNIDDNNTWTWLSQSRREHIIHECLHGTSSPVGVLVHLASRYWLTFDQATYHGYIYSALCLSLSIASLPNTSNTQIKHPILLLLPARLPLVSLHLYWDSPTRPDNAPVYHPIPYKSKMS